MLPATTQQTNPKEPTRKATLKQLSKVMKRLAKVLHGVEYDSPLYKQTAHAMAELDDLRIAIEDAAPIRPI